VNMNKTEAMICAKTEEPLHIITDRNGKVLKQVENFRYLGSVFHATSGCEEDVKTRI